MSALAVCCRGYGREAMAEHLSQVRLAGGSEGVCGVCGNGRPPVWGCVAEAMGERQWQAT